MDLPPLPLDRVLADEFKDRDHWFAQRRGKVTASEVPTLYGEGYVTVERLAALKRGVDTPDSPNKYMRVGSELEDLIFRFIKEDFADQHWVRCGLLIEDALQPRLAATPDVITAHEGKLCPVQIKYSAFGRKRLLNELPPYMRIQVHAEMAVLDAPQGVLAVLHKHPDRKDPDMNPLQLYHVERDENLINGIRDAVGQFWLEEMAE